MSALAETAWLEALHQRMVFGLPAWVQDGLRVVTLVVQVDCIESGEWGVEHARHVWLDVAEDVAPGLLAWSE